MVTFIIAILMFGILITVHEFGHYIVARLCGIHVLDFAIGFGPSIWEKKKNGTTYALRMIPLGGYCRMLGEEEASDSENAFNNKTVLQRILVVIAGATMNFIIAILVFSIIGFSMGVSTLTIDTVDPAGIAYEAGVLPGDKILKVDDVRVRLWEDLTTQISMREGKDTVLTVNRAGKEEKISFHVEKNEEGTYLGISSKVVKHSLGRSIINGFQKTYWIVKTTIVELVKIITRKVAPDLIGPIGMIYVVKEAASVGLYNVLFLFALISANLGLMNLLPIPALDGGSVLFLIIEGIRGKPIPVEKEAFVHMLGFGLLILLMLYVGYQDFLRFIIK